MKCILCHKVECETLCKECLKEDLDVRLAALQRNEIINKIQIEFRRNCISKKKLINPDEYIKSIEELNSVKDCIGGDLIMQEQIDLIKNIPKMITDNQDKINQLKTEIRYLRKQLLMKNTDRQKTKIEHSISIKKRLIDKLGGKNED
jgi:uncharacterized coiled-coil protein SlyX